MGSAKWTASGWGFGHSTHRLLARQVQGKLGRAVARASRYLAEGLEKRTLLSTIVVTNTADSGPGSLRAAITAANSDAVPDSIEFDIPGPGPYTISMVTAFPSIEAPVSIDGATQPGYAGMPIVEITGRGLSIYADNCLVRGLVINRSSSGGIWISGNANLVQGNYIGIGADGTSSLGNSREGIWIGGNNNTIGGPLPEHRNVVSSGGGQETLFRGTTSVRRQMAGLLSVTMPTAFGSAETTV